jgi:hypothetical protein
MQNDAGENVDLYIPRKWCVCLLVGSFFLLVGNLCVVIQLLDEQNPVRPRPRCRTGMRRSRLFAAFLTLIQILLV